MGSYRKRHVLSSCARVIVFFIAMLRAGISVAQDGTSVERRPGPDASKQVETRLQLPDRVKNSGTVVNYRIAYSQSDSVTGAVRLPFPMLAPPDVAAQLADGNSKFKVLIDPEDPQWYTIIDSRNASYEVRVSGDAYLLPTNSGACDIIKSKSFATFVGGPETNGDAIHTDGTDEWAEYTLRQNCVPYTLQAKCFGSCGTGNGNAQQVLRKYILKTIASVNVELTGARGPRQQNGAPTRQLSAEEFRFVKPGLLLDFKVPITMTDSKQKNSKGEDIIIHTCSPSGPATQQWLPIKGLEPSSLDMKVEYFPIGLASNEAAFAGSQILTAGGTFSPIDKPDHRFGDCDNVSELGRQIVGKNGVTLERNMPWRDTFCEWRGHGGKRVPFCGPRSTKGSHEGIDVRAPTNEEKWKVISATRGIVDGVNPRNGQISIRFRDSRYFYLHMKLDAEYERVAKVGHIVYAGMPLGTLSSQMDGAAHGTTRHLHWEIMRPVPFDKYVDALCERGKTCRVWENWPPYATAIYAYARSKGTDLPVKCDRGADGKTIGGLCRLTKSQYEISDFQQLKNLKIEHAKMLDIGPEQ